MWTSCVCRERDDTNERMSIDYRLDSQSRHCFSDLVYRRRAPCAFHGMRWAREVDMLGALSILGVYATILIIRYSAV
jgi:hypothetical protein